MEVETQEWIGVASCERPSLKPEAMVMSQSELPLRAISGPVAMQQQQQQLVLMSRSRITTIEHGDVLGWRPC